MRVPLLFICWLLVPGLAHANHPLDLRALMAHPETPVVSLNFRGTLRGSVGITIPAVDEESHGGFGFYVPVLIELHNGPCSDQGLPNENWRAFLALDATWRKRFDEGPVRRLDLGVAIQHQSDHHTGRDLGGTGQLQQNDLRLRAEIMMPVGKEAAFVLAGETRVFAVSCTLEYHCGTFLGDWSFGGAIDLLFDLKGAIEDYRGWSYFASIHGGGIFPNELVIRERRLIVQTGARVKTDFGQWQLFGSFWVGNAVGINRFEQAIHGGGGFRWSW